MSAWIVSKEHVDVMLTGALQLPEHNRPGFSRGDRFVRLDFTNVDEIGRALLAECVASVSCRYSDTPEHELPGHEVERDVEGEILYTFSRVGFRPSVGEILKAIGCYEYQSCEHGSWETSEAKAFCESLTRALVGTLYEGPWGWDAETIAERRAEWIGVA